MTYDNHELAVRPQAWAAMSPRLIVSPIRAMTASSSVLGCALGAMAAWTAHLAGAGIVLTAVAGHVGLLQRQWIAAALAPAAVVTCLAAAPILLAEGALHRAQEAVAGEVLARERVGPPRE
jgi:hypothetical protein